MSQAGIINSSGMPAVATLYTTNAGNAVPALNVLNVLGTAGITTSGAGNTITITTTDPSVSGTVNTIGAVTGDVITFPCGAVPGTYTFDIKVSAFESTTPLGAGYGIIASVRTTGAAAVLLPNQAIDEMEEGALVAGACVVTVGGNNMIVRVTGTAALTVKWKAVAEYTFIS